MTTRNDYPPQGSTLLMAPTQSGGLERRDLPGGVYVKADSVKVLREDYVKVFRRKEAFRL